MPNLNSLCFLPSTSISQEDQTISGGWGVTHQYLLGSPAAFADLPYQLAISEVRELTMQQQVAAGEPGRLDHTRWKDR